MKPGALAVRVDADLKEALQRLANADDRSLSNYIERILKAHVDAKTAPRARLVTNATDVAGKG